jgi:hypothetical protein
MIGFPTKRKFEGAHIDQDFLIATKTKLAIAAGADQAAVAAAATKVPELADYLASTFTLKPGDRPHLLKF